MIFAMFFPWPASHAPFQAHALPGNGAFREQLNPIMVNSGLMVAGGARNLRPVEFARGVLKKRLRVHPHPLPTTQVMGHHGWLAGDEDGL